LFFPCNSDGDDVIVYTDNTRKQRLETLHHLRQQNIKAPGRPNYCLSDFIAPIDSGKADYIGAFAVTTGIGIEEKLQHLSRITMITVRSCLKRWQTDWRKRLQNTCIKWSEKTIGAMPKMKPMNPNS